METTTTTQEIAPLEDVLSYKNEDVIRGFMKNFSLSYEDTSELFRETLKWLYLGAYTIANGETEKRRAAITNNIIILDEMWHNFILFTKDYASFCRKYFGFYLHHQPTTHSEYENAEQQVQVDPVEYLNKVKDQYREQLSLVYDVLGKETVSCWYGKFADLYTEEKLKELYKRHK